MIIAPREVTVVLNHTGQAALIAFEGWPSPLPERIILRSNGNFVMVWDGRGNPLARAQADSSPGLLLATEVHLATVGYEGIVMLGSVPHSWR